MADSLFGDLGLDEQTPTVLDFLGQETPLAFRAEPALPTGGPVAGGTAPATVAGEGTTAAGEAAAGAAGGLLRRGGAEGDSALQSILRGLDVASDPTIRDLIAKMLSGGGPPGLTMDQLFADFPQTIIGPSGLGPGDIDLATAAEQGLTGAEGWSGLSGSSILPYLGAVGAGLSSGGEFPAAGAAQMELINLLATYFGGGVPGLSIATGVASAFAPKIFESKPSSLQKKQANTQFASDLGKQMIVDLQEATTPEELAQVLQSYSSGQYPVTFRSVLGGENVPTVDLDQILGPDFNVGVEGINTGDLGGQIGPSIANMVRYNAQLLKAAQAGDPEAVAQLQGRTAQKARYQSGIKAIQDAGIPLTQEMLRGIYLNAIGDNAFPFTDRAGALQRVSETNLMDPTLAGPAFAALNAMGVPMPAGQRTAAETLARTAVGSAAGGFTGPDVERALREYQTALGATERAGTEGLSWDQALEAQRAWEDLMRSGSA